MNNSFVIILLFKSSLCHSSKDLGFIASFNRIPNLHLTLRRYRCLFSTLTNLIFQQSFCVLVRLWGLSLFDIANIRSLFNIASETLIFNMYLTQKKEETPPLITPFFAMNITLKPQTRIGINVVLIIRLLNRKLLVYVVGVVEYLSHLYITGWQIKLMR